MSEALSADAQRLLAVISAGRRTRWPLDELEARHLEALPHMRGRPERRRELGTLIGELANAGRVRASARRDTTQMPPLPAFVDVAREARDATSHRDGRGHGWRPELGDVLNLQPAATPAELRILRQANRWLADRGEHAAICGSRERSLEVFGDEKLLDERLRYGRLFASGLLSYELLQARRVAPGLVYEQVGTAPCVLVVENADTFRALTDVLAQRPADGVGAVAWGAGAAFEQSCEALSTLTVAGRPLQRCWYFGDIDPSGVRIPARAAAAVAPLALAPAVPLYQLLLDRDRRVTARERAGDETDGHLQWLGEPLATRAREVMRASRRLPQEALTAELLAPHDGSLV
jgi:hypothetical protein